MEMKNPDFIPFMRAALQKAVKSQTRAIETPAETARRLGVPLVPAQPEAPNSFPEHNPVVAICGQCGHECRRMSFFRCQNYPCPVQPSIF